MNYRIVFRSIGRVTAEVQGSRDDAEALYSLLSGDTRIVSVALYQPNDDVAIKSHSRARPVLRANETVNIIRP